MYIRPDYSLPTGFNTKLKLIYSMDELLAKHDFDELSTDMICKAAGIGKTTFYRHFSSKYDAVKWFALFAAEQGIHRIGISLDWEEGQIKTFNVWGDVRNLCEKAATVKGYESLSRFSTLYRRDYLIHVVTEHLGLELTELIEFQIKAYSYMETGMVMDWFRSCFEKSPKTMARLLVSTVPKELYELVSLKERTNSKCHHEFFESDVGDADVFLKLEQDCIK